jgi:UDP-N-acetylmuramoyl-tripeptide--D-alanyl-D-alanine ligase
MGENFKLILVLLFIPVAVRRILTWLYWVQAKEYRFDRFKVFIESREGKRALNVYSWSTEVFLTLLAYVEPFLGYLILIYLLCQNFDGVSNLLNKRVRKPVFTQRILLILLTTFAFILFLFGCYMYFFTNIFILIILWEVSSLMGIMVGVLWTIILTNRVKKREITLAKEKLEAIKPLVIGVTGSYGKTSTKEFLAQILSSEAKTLYTTGNENTELGVTRMIINKLDKGTKFLVVEMGAYKKGEIEAICNIVKPKIGIITGIEPQHLALFGDLKTIKNTKFELIKSLPKRGFAFFNYSNKYSFKLADRVRKLSTKLKVFGYGISDGKVYPKKVDCIAQIVNQTADGVEFKVKVGNESAIIYAPLKGKHFVENLAGAILVAYQLGIPLNKIKDVCAALQSLPGTMSVYKFGKSSYLIDDSYNTTPSGFESALEYLQVFNNFKKIVVTPGIIELGKDSKKIHYKIGKLLKNVDVILLTNNEFETDIAKGLGIAKDRLKILSNIKKVENELRGVINQQKVALLIEGRIPKTTKDIINYYKK